MLISVDESAWGLAKCALTTSSDDTPLHIVLNEGVAFGELDSCLRSELVGFAVDDGEAMIHIGWLECQLRLLGKTLTRDLVGEDPLASGMLTARIVSGARRD